MYRVTERQLLRVNEAADSLGIGRTKLYELINRGEIPVIRVGRAVRIPMEAIEAWISRRLAEAGFIEGGAA